MIAASLLLGLVTAAQAQPMPSEPGPPAPAPPAPAPPAPAPPAPGAPSPAPPPPAGLTCEPCDRARALLDELGETGDVLRGAVGTLRRIADEPGLDLYDELDPSELRAIELVATRGRGALYELSALVCNGTGSLCIERVLDILDCVLDDHCRDRADLERAPRDDPSDPGTCDPYVVHVRAPRTGLGGELVTGWHDSASPVEGRAWGFGIEARRLLTRRLSAIIRVDHVRGRDAGEDSDGDGRDDTSTGPIRRWSLLAGPTLVLASSLHHAVPRMLELDLLVGGIVTSSQPGEDGLVAGADLNYRISALRIGVRALHGMVGASDVRMVLAHVGVTVGATPSASYGGGCPGVGPPPASTTRWALGFDLPLSGYSPGGLGYVAPGFALEGAYHLHHRVDLLVRGDLLAFPRGDADRVLHQGLLAGARLDLSRHKRFGSRTGLFLAMVAGYGLASTTEPTRAGSGPVVDASIGWGGQGSDGAGWLRLHGRFGLTEDNADLRAIFLSAGLEVRIDRERWRDRL